MPPKTEAFPSLLGGIVPRASWSTSTAATKLLAWYDANRRDIPWRSEGLVDGSPNPYYIWVSEIMCQQTQIATVIPYWRRWISSFPTVEVLAAASEEKVREHWQGLGYYRRAGYLHQGAKKLVADFHGTLPKTLDDLRKIPGIGAYTAAAVASISFKVPAPVVDGNVLRVIARVRGHQQCNVKDTQVIKRIWQDAGDLINETPCSAKRPGDWNQALMEIGATVCKPGGAPRCGDCPLRSVCRAKQLLESKEIAQIEEIIPLVKEKTKQRVEQVACCFVENSHGEVLLVRRPKEGLLANLLEVPSCPVPGDHDQRPDHRALLASLLGIGTATDRGESSPLQHEVQVSTTARSSRDELTSQLQEVGQIVHVFSHIKMTVFVYRLSANSISKAKRKSKLSDDGPVRWVSKSAIVGDVPSVAMSNIVKKVTVLCEAPRVDRAKRSKRDR